MKSTSKFLMDGQTDGQTDRRTDRQTDGQTDRRQNDYNTLRAYMAEGKNVYDSRKKEFFYEKTSQLRQSGLTLNPMQKSSKYHQQFQKDL